MFKFESNLVANKWVKLKLPFSRLAHYFILVLRRASYLVPSIIYSTLTLFDHRLYNQSLVPTNFSRIKPQNHFFPSNHWGPSRLTSHFVPTRILIEVSKIILPFFRVRIWIDPVLIPTYCIFANSRDIEQKKRDL